LRSGFFLLFVCAIEMGCDGFMGSIPFFGAVGGPGLWSVLFGIALIMIGSRSKRFGKQT
jgi:hypothetical protein